MTSPAHVLLLLLLASPLTAQVCTTPGRLEETFRLGSVDGPAALGNVSDFDIDTQGRMYIPQGSTVLVFDAQGKPLPSIGRAGQGPGEFSVAARWLGFKGDTLWVTDLGSTHFFGPDGRELDQVRFTTPVGAQGRFGPQTPLADGSFIGDRVLTAESIRLYPVATRLPLLRFSRTGAVLDTIAFGGWSGPRFVEGQTDHPLQEWGGIRAPGESLLPIVATPDGKAVVLIGDIREKTEAPSLLNLGGLLVKPLGSFDLLRIGIDGDTILEATLPFELKPTKPLQDWLRESYGARMAGDFTTRDPRNPNPAPNAAANERRRVEAREAITFPEFLPPVRRIVAGQDGTTWLLRELREDHGDLWEVYDQKGDPVGSVLIPDGRSEAIPWAPHVRVLRASRDEMWGMTIDDLDVPTIHRYRVRRACN